MTNVLVVDDDPKLLAMVRRTLSYEGFAVQTATNGKEALDKLAGQSFDVMVLDWLMPEINGIDVARYLRDMDNEIPILMLTARDTVPDRVKGLDSGADDYLVKPFAPTELLARLRALVRRSNLGGGDEPLAYADLSLNPLTREVQRSDRAIELTPKEFDLLRFMLRHPRQVLTRQQILEEVWGYDFGGEDNILEVYVGYLRKKTEAGGEPRLIQTVRGIGYVLREA